MSISGCESDRRCEGWGHVFLSECRCGKGFDKHANICACVYNEVCVMRCVYICIVHMNPYAHLICGRNFDKCSCITRAWLQLPVPRGHEKWHPQSLAGWQLKSYALLQVSAYACMRD